MAREPAEVEDQLSAVSGVTVDAPALMPQTASAAAEQYEEPQPLTALTRVVFVCLLAQLALAGLSLGAAWLRLGLILDVIDGERVTIERANEADNLVEVASRLSLLAVVVTGCFFIWWLYRANRNLEHRGVRLGLSSGWAIGAWFVPIINLWFPFRVVSQCWRGSDEDAVQPDGWKNLAQPVAIVLWWAAFLGASFTRVGGEIVYDSITATLEDLREAEYWFIASGLLRAFAAMLLMMIVLEIDRRQGEALAGGATTEPVAQA